MNFNDFLVGLISCFLLSFALGLERQYRRRSLGLRTMILVAIGSYMFGIFSFLVTDMKSDVLRIAAGVVTGIGFLGAGVIIKDNEKNRISGLTTAATLWCDSALGILCSGGFIKEAVASAIIILFSNTVLRYLNILINERVESMSINEKFNIILYTDNNKVMEYINELIVNNNYLSANDYKVTDNKITFNLYIKKNSEKKVYAFINSIISKFEIKKYEYKKIEEIRSEENDEL